MRTKRGYASGDRIEVDGSVGIGDGQQARLRMYTGAQRGMRVGYDVRDEGILFGAQNSNQRRIGGQYGVECGGTFGTGDVQDAGWGIVRCCCARCKSYQTRGYLSP